MITTRATKTLWYIEIGGESVVVPRWAGRHRRSESGAIAHAERILAKRADKILQVSS